MAAQSFPRWVLISLSSMAAIAAAACASMAPGAQALAGTSWTAQSINGQAIVGPRTPTLNFAAEQRVSGSGGCNSYFGAYTLRSGALSIGEMGRTEMACEVPIMQQEDTFLAALGDARAFDMTNETLTIHTDKDSVLVFSRAPS